MCLPSPSLISQLERNADLGWFILYREISRLRLEDLWQTKTVKTCYNSVQRELLTEVYRLFT